jgi:lipoprotein-releasing system ATP-binding protein
MSEPLLSARGVSKSFRTGDRKVDVLQGVDLDVVEGETVAIVGQSGVGKSTLLHILGALDPPDGGKLRFRGHKLDRDLADHRNRNVGFVFQFHYLLPEFTALENVEMPFRIRRADFDYSAVARRTLIRLGLEQRLHHRPGELSGGEQQRVAIARAVIGDPPLVLADEPTGDLDPATGREVFHLLSELQREHSFSLVLVTHNEQLARGCDRVLRLDDGRLETLDEAETRDYFNGVGV